MSDQPLSQDEIDALIAAGGEEGSGAPTADLSEPVEQSAPDQQAWGAGADQSSPVVRPMEFSTLSQGQQGGFRNGVDLIMDVNLQVAVELGRTTMRVKEVLSLGPGSVVELDKHAGEPVEVVVNNKTVARGEVVVIDENFGVRITEIVDARNRESDARAA